MVSKLLDQVRSSSCTAFSKDDYCQCTDAEQTTTLRQTITISGASLGAIADDFGVALPRYIQSVIASRLPLYKGELTVVSMDEQPHGSTYTDAVVIDYTVYRPENLDWVAQVAEQLQDESLIQSAMELANVDLASHTVVSACVRGKYCDPPAGAGTLENPRSMIVLP